MKIKTLYFRVVTLCLLFQPAVFLHALESQVKEQFFINSPIHPPAVTNNHDGFEDLLAMELFKRMGLNPVIHNVPAERGLKNLNAGYDDAILSRVAGLQKSYPNIVQIDEPVNERQYIAFARKDIKVNNWADLKIYNVTHVIGWKIFEKNVKQYRTITPVREPYVMFTLLDKDRADVALYGLDAGKLLIKQMGLKNIHPVFPPLAVRKKYFYLNKKHAHLVPLANETLRKMKSDGTFERLRKQVLTNLMQPENNAPVNQ